MCKDRALRTSTGVHADSGETGMADAESFRELYRESYPHVLAYATSLVGRQAGEDITSEVFAIAWRRRAEVWPIALPWLLGVARNLVHELRRRDARQYELAVAEGVRISTHAGPYDPAEDVAERLAVLAALARLSDPDRELLTLMAWQGLSTSEAAQVFGCSSPTLTVRLHRARRRFERALESQADPADPPPDVAARPAPSSGRSRHVLSVIKEAESA
jgi:RNA polymerase sigma-70 factor, ECF subfamily